MVCLCSVDIFYRLLFLIAHEALEQQRVCSVVELTVVIQQDIFWFQISVTNSTKIDLLWTPEC